MLLDENKVIILDTTLRDGELTPGVQFDLQQKLEIARRLESLGVDLLEVGYPGQYEKDIREIFEISQTIHHSTICGLARCQTAEILKVSQALEPTSRGRIHLYSNVHIPLSTNKETVLAEISQSVRFARKYCDDIQWSAFDATRSDRDFLCRAIAVAIDSGAKTIGIPDSLGVILPENFSKLIQRIYNQVSNLNQAILSVHCHDDQGMAVENTIAALDSGVRQIECTINGLGARKGNTDLAKIVRAIATQTRYQTSIKINDLPQVSEFIRHLIEVDKL
jgi:2-isopropylmalate synthase